MKCAFALVAISLLWGCSTTGHRFKPDIEITGSSKAGSELDPVPEIRQSELDDLERTLDARLAASLKQEPVSDQAIGSKPSEIVAKIPLEMNEKVKKWIHFFIGKDASRFQRFSGHGKAYQPMIQTVLARQGVPPEIYYLALIESGFQTQARSRASAVGIWQLVAGTAQRYGLRVDAYADERKDPIRSTEAAAKYLKDLHNIFQSWYLAMAAYNAGEMRIMGAIMRGKTRDFWKLVEKGVLPNETMNYIPKFIAAAMIDQYPEKFGIAESSPQWTFPRLEAVQVPSPVRLSDVAHFAGLTQQTLQELNPHLKRGMTPPGTKSYPIWVPLDRVEDLKADYTHLEARKLRDIFVARKVSDHLPGRRLAKYGRSHNRYRIQSALGLAAHRHYLVKPGDSLEAIARRFGLTIHTLKRLNRIAGSTIYIGQSLKVFQDQADSRT